MKHTPGPWYIDRQYDGQQWTGSHSIAYGDPNRASQGHIAHTTRGFGEAEQLANARLIAAAPDLYEACDSIEQAVGPLSERYVNKELNDALRKVRAALAKAEP